MTHIYLYLQIYFNCNQWFLVAMQIVFHYVQREEMQLTRSSCSISLNKIHILKFKQLREVNLLIHM